jgi:ribonuclease HI
MSSTTGNVTLIFADGACSGNPGPGGWGAVIAHLSGEVVEMGGREVPSTNNRMELAAVIYSLESVRREDLTEVCTDSVYVIRGITEWIWGWRKKGWLTAEGKEVANTDLWQKLFSVVAQRKIKWRYVRGHSGIPGNERVDAIAVAFSKGQRIPLYRGSLLKYDVPIHDLPANTDLPEGKPKESLVKKKAYSYLSLIAGTPLRHSTWPECEGRVKGRPGAKFKKAMSAADEIEILRSWGYRPEDIK